MLTVESALAMFIMLAISSISLFLAQRAKIPHTVILVLIGVFLGALSFTSKFGFIDDLTLTPELLFYIFLPTLIFESAFSIHIKRLTDDAVIISVLSVISLLVSAVAIAFGLDIAFGLMHLDIPFIFSLLFGSIISATDPVAVLALFKEYGAPRRLSLIFEGESIFNDGTGVALFLVVLAIAESGLYGVSDIAHGTLSFIFMVIGGIIFGLVSGGIFAKLVGYTRSNEYAAVTLTIVLAHLTFICTDLLSQHLVIGGMAIHLSPIIATAVASLLMGNYGRYKLPAHATEFVEKYWSQFAFLANSLIFILIGMLAIQLPREAIALIPVIVMTILIVAGSRALSIYPVVRAFNFFTTDARKIPTSWQHVLSWGSLRGALAVTMVLMIPDTLTFPGWTFELTPKELILTLTISCVFATLFIKATTIGFFMKKLKLDTLTLLEEINFREMIVYVYNTTIKKLEDSFKKGYVNEAAFKELTEEQHTRIRLALGDLKLHTKEPETLRKVIKLHAIGIERKYVNELFAYNEITEDIIKRVMSKLEYQTQAIEHGQYEENEYEYGRSLDVFEILAQGLRNFTKPKPAEVDLSRNKYLYYRALAIVSRKVTKELKQLEDCFTPDFTLPHEIIRETIALYEHYREGSLSKMEALREENPVMFSQLDESLARLSLYKNETILLAKLRDRNMVTSKVSIALTDHFERDNARVTS